MELKKALVLFGLLGIFASGFGAESSAGAQHLPSMKLLMRGAVATEAVDESPRAVFEKRSTESKESSKVGPLNVILLLVDELYRSDVSAYFENKDDFSVRGYLETCPDVTDDSMASSCDCDEKLGSSIASLISWAQRANMTTSGIYEMSASLSDPRARLIYRQTRDASWLLKTDSSADDKAKVAEKLKDSFIRSLVNGLNIGDVQEPSVVYRADLNELTLNVLKELSLKQNKRGHLAIVRTGGEGLRHVLEHLKHSARSNILTVVMNSCPKQTANQLVPFFAGGLASGQLSHVDNLKELRDLPSAIRAIINQNYEEMIESMPNDSIIKDKRAIRSLEIIDHQRHYRQDAPAAGAAPDGVDLAPCKDTKLPELDACITPILAAKVKACDDACIATSVATLHEIYAKKIKQADGENGNGQEAITQSTMMIITVVTATISYAIQF